MDDSKAQRTGKKRRFTFQMPEEELEAARKIAASRGQTFSEYVGYCIRRMVDRKDTKQDPPG